MNLGMLLATYKEAENNFQVPVKHLTNGLYFISVQDKSGKTATLKIVKSNKSNFLIQSFIGNKFIIKNRIQQTARLVSNSLLN